MKLKQLFIRFNIFNFSHVYFSKLFQLCLFIRIERTGPVILLRHSLDSKQPLGAGWQSWFGPISIDNKVLFLFSSIYLCVPYYINIWLSKLFLYNITENLSQTSITIDLSLLTRIFTENSTKGTRNRLGAGPDIPKPPYCTPYSSVSVWWKEFRRFVFKFNSLTYEWQSYGYILDSIVFTVK